LIYNDELSFHVGGAVTLHLDPVAEYEVNNVLM